MVELKLVIISPVQPVPRLLHSIGQHMVTPPLHSLIRRKLKLAHHRVNLTRLIQSKRKATHRHMPKLHTTTRLVFTEQTPRAKQPTVQINLLLRSVKITLRQLTRRHLSGIHKPPLIPLTSLHLSLLETEPLLVMRSHQTIMRTHKS